MLLADSLIAPLGFVRVEGDADLLFGGHHRLIARRQAWRSARDPSGCKIVYFTGFRV